MMLSLFELSFGNRISKYVVSNVPKPLLKILNIFRDMAKYPTQCLSQIVRFTARTASSHWKHTVNKPLNTRHGDSVLIVYTRICIYEWNCKSARCDWSDHSDDETSGKFRSSASQPCLRYENRLCGSKVMNFRKIWRFFSSWWMIFSAGI